MLWWSASWQEQPAWNVFNVQQEVWQEIFSAPPGPQPEAAPPNLVWIPCGTFTMGSPDSEPARVPAEGPQTRVTLSQGIWMGKYEVTQGDYSAVTGSNPSAFTGDASRPVEQVSWNDAVAYCAALTARERAAGRLPAGYAYRLPTEAEWEYACRASTTTPFHYGSALRSGMADFLGHFEYPPCGATPSYCFNAAGVYLRRTTAVGSYAPNAWGLHDMHGNVGEWCQDWWSASLPGGSVTDPQGPPTGLGRVIRGGSWTGFAYHCRSAIRFDHDPAGGANYIGFRVVLAPGKP
jgi:formylglycine-generating enzyme required for sulfatase activity